MSSVGYKKLLCVVLVIWNVLFICASCSTMLIWFPNRRGGDMFLTGFSVYLWCAGILCWTILWLMLFLKVSPTEPILVDKNPSQKYLVYGSFVFYVLAIVVEIMADDASPLALPTHTEPWYDPLFQSAHQWFTQSTEWAFAMMVMGGLGALILAIALLFKKKIRAYWVTRMMGLGLLLLWPPMTSMFMREYLVGQFKLDLGRQDAIYAAVDYPDVFNAVSVGNFSFSFLIFLLGVAFTTWSYVSPQTCKEY